MTAFPWSLLGWPFWALALAGSLFYAWKCFDVFTSGKVSPFWAWRLHQRWFNFLGAFTGWVALYFLLRKISECAAAGCASALSYADAGSFLFAFVGVTGYLPHTATTIMKAIADIAGKLLGLVKVP